MDSRSDHAHKISKIIARAWLDESFKKRLIENPREVLAEEQVEIADNVELVVLESADDKAYLVIPPPPEQELDAVKVKDVRLSGDFSSTRGTDGFSSGCYTSCVA